LFSLELEIFYTDVFYTEVFVRGIFYTLGRLGKGRKWCMTRLQRRVPSTASAL